MRLLFAFRTCRKKPHHYQQTAQSARAIPASQRMNTISTTKATSFSPNNTTSAADTAAKVSVNTVPTETKNHNFQGVPTPSEWSGCTLQVLVPANSRKILRLLAYCGLSAAILNAEGIFPGMHLSFVRAENFLPLLVSKSILSFQLRIPGWQAGAAPRQAEQALRKNWPSPPG